MYVVNSLNIIMIISHEHKFIFIKTRKTAGSAIEKYLVNYLNPDVDVCSGSEYDGTPGFGKVKGGHKTAKWIAERYPNEWKNYYKFSVVRNPWDTMVSFYYWYKKGKPSKIGRYDFDFFLQGKPLSYWNDWKRGMFTINDTIVVDHICKYENLHEELRKIPIPYNDEILTTFAKQGLREVKDYRELYNQETKEKVAVEFDDIINKFSYNF